MFSDPWQEPIESQELWHLAEIWFSLWNSQYVPWVQRLDCLCCCHPVLSRYGCPSSRSRSCHSGKFWNDFAWKSNLIILSYSDHPSGRSGCRQMPSPARQAVPRCHHQIPSATQGQHDRYAPIVLPQTPHLLRLIIGIIVWDFAWIIHLAINTWKLIAIILRLFLNYSS